MDPIIDLSEVLKDSPNFRTVIGKYETEIDVFEKTVVEVLKHSNLLVELGKQYVKTKQ